MTSKTKPLIAIVDDDESVCRALHRLVRSMGMNVQTFPSGLAFLELFEALPSFQPDCVVLDMQMPGLNGLEVQNRLRLSHRQVPIIIITAHDQLGTRERAIAAGAVAYLRKPFNDAAFSQVLRVALGLGPEDEEET